MMVKEQSKNISPEIMEEIIQEYKKGTKRSKIMDKFGIANGGQFTAIIKMALKSEMNEKIYVKIESDGKTAKEINPFKKWLNKQEIEKWIKKETNLRTFEIDLSLSIKIEPNTTHKAEVIGRNKIKILS